MNHIFFFGLKNGLKRRNLTNFVNAIPLNKTQEIEKSTLLSLKYPLGMLEYPFSSLNLDKKLTKTWREKLKDVLSSEQNREQRKQLMKEISMSYWSDFQAMKYHQGKTWIAPKYLFEKDKALYIANFSGTTLSNITANTTSLIESSPASLVGIFSSKSGENHVKSFLSLELQQAVPKMQFIDINLQESLLKSMLVRLFSSNIKRQIPKEQHSKYFFVSKLSNNIKENMKILNRYVGYIYLVDNQCKIRWAGCGNATEEEKKYLITCSQKLLEEYKKNAELRYK